MSEGTSEGTSEQEPRKKLRGHPYNSVAWWRLTLMTHISYAGGFRYAVGVDLTTFRNPYIPYEVDYLPKQAVRLAYVKVFEQLAVWMAEHDLRAYHLSYQWEYVGGDEYISSEEGRREQHSSLIVS